jgi:carnitine O-palmitoyltransferase 1, liver isoform
MCTVNALIIWLTICLTLRYTLKFLLMYKGYLFESRGKGISLKTKIWGMLVRVLLKWNSPALFSFQGSLPRQSVPTIKDTISRYLKSMRPIYDDETYESVQKEAEKFENGIAKKLQRYIVLKSWWSNNYYTDWWEEYAYLKNRDPLMYGSNYYGSDTIYPGTSSQATRAACLTYFMLKFKERIDNQELQPIMLQGLVPLCSWQYERLFNTCRIPGIESDKIVHVEDSKHIVVMHKGCYYKMNVYDDDDELYNSAELQLQIEEILQSKPSNSSTEKHIPALTAWNRTRWAEVRNEYFASGINKESLNAIESAAFVLSLDDEPYIYDLKSSPEEYGTYGKQLLVGNGHNRWYDKSFNLCVSSNGRVSSIIAMSFSLFKINILIRNSLGFTVNTHGLMHL